MTNSEQWQGYVREAFLNRSKLQKSTYREAVESVVRELDQGTLRVAEKVNENWVTHAWIKEAILLFFALRDMKVFHENIFEYYDKIPLKQGYEAAGVRVVPPATVRYGAFIERGAVLMPSYVNIGARVGSGTMVDTWATVGSCAQIGCDCHLAGGVGIGGVLEPPNAQPVIVEDGVFIGSRVIVVEGVVVEKEAVLGAGVILTSSTLILDVTGNQPVEYRGRIPTRSVVIPGVRQKEFPAGTFGVPCAMIIGRRSESTDRKVSLNAALRDFNVPV